ncbi:MAG: hypothetical protein JSR33_03360 [Proteobacteria bacterium]|nr:hypothetical protein [Pseudomonadota bacterium]
MKGSTLKKVLSVLSETETKNSPLLSHSSLGELKPEQMKTILQRLFSDSVHVIDPALSLQASPFAAKPVKLVGVVQYLQALRSLPLTPLKKPVVMLVAQPQVEQKSQTTHFSSGGSSQGARVTVQAWRAFVIVPQYYQPPEGKSVGNDLNPLVYYFDPQRQLNPDQAPVEVLEFCHALSQGCQVPATHRGLQVRVGPVFKQLGFLHGCRDICAEIQDSGWWALYFAIMAVARGGVSFPETDHLSLFQLQATFGSLLVEPMTLLEPRSSASSVVESSSSSFLSFSSTSSGSTVADISTSSSRFIDQGSEVKTTSALETKQDLKPTSSPVSEPTPSPSMSPEKSSIPLSEPDKESKKPPATPVKAPLGSNYTPQMIMGILRAYQIALTLDGKLSRDSSGQFELMAYSLQPFNKHAFLQDILQYWQAKQGRLENRRVAHIISTSNQHPIALVVQYAAPDTGLASRLWQEQSAARTMSIEALLKVESLKREFRRFYGSVEVTVLGTRSNPALVKQLQNPLQEVFQGTQIALSFKSILNKPGYTQTLTEDILGMLQHGQTVEVDVAAVMAIHQQRCEQAILKQWDQAEHKDSPTQQELLTTLRTVMVWSTLLGQRRLNYGVHGEDYTANRARQARDQAMKRHLYAQRFRDREALLTVLPLDVLTSFLLTPDITTSLQTLNQHKDQLRGEMIKWEAELADKVRRQRAKPCAALTEVLQFIYHSTFLGLGGKLFYLSVQKAVSENTSIDTTEHKQQANQSREIAAWEAKTVSGLVRKITRSPSLANRTEESVRVFLGDEPISRSLGVVGTALGGLLQLTLGPYALLQMLGVAALTRQGYHWVQAEQIHELTAELKDPAWSVPALHRVSYLLWHGVEALVVGSPFPLATALGGLAGSAITTTVVHSLTRKKLPTTGPEREAKAKDSADPGLFTLLICLGGSILGQNGIMVMFNAAISLQHRLLYRDAAVALLSHAASSQPEIKTWAIETPSFRTSPSFWFNQRNPLWLAWTTQSGQMRTVECEIKGLPILTPQGITGLVCTGDIPATEISSTLGLPKP